MFLMIRPVNLLLMYHTAENEVHTENDVSNEIDINYVEMDAMMDIEPELPRKQLFRNLDEVTDENNYTPLPPPSKTRFHCYGRQKNIPS